MLYNYLFLKIMDRYLKYSIIKLMDCFNSVIFLGIVLYTFCLTRPHKKRSAAVRLDDLGSERKVKFLDINWF